jgi:hypothetical protein
MKLKKLSIGLIGAIGGVLGNLLAAFIQESWGRITLFQALFIVLGIFIALVVAERLEYGSKKSQEQILELENRLRLLRRDLELQRARHSSGIIWSPEDIDSYLEKQRRIDEAKLVLRAQGQVVAEEPIDVASPGKLPRLTRIALGLKQVRTLLFFAFALVVAVPLSLLSQVIVASIINVPIDISPTPTTTATVQVTLPVPEVLGTSTPELVATLDVQTVDLVETPMGESTSSELSPLQIEGTVEKRLTPRAVEGTPTTSTPIAILPSRSTPTPTRARIISIVKPKDTEFILGQELNVSWEGELASEEEWFTLEIHAVAVPKQGYLPGSVPNRISQFSGPIRQNEWLVNRNQGWVCMSSGGHTEEACQNVNIQPGAMQLCVLLWTNVAPSTPEAPTPTPNLREPWTTIYNGTQTLSRTCVAFDWYN